MSRRYITPSSPACKAPKRNFACQPFRIGAFVLQCAQDIVCAKEETICGKPLYRRCRCWRLRRSSAGRSMPCRLIHFRCASGSVCSCAGHIIAACCAASLPTGRRRPQRSRQRPLRCSRRGHGLCVSSAGGHPVFPAHHLERCRSERVCRLPRGDRCTGVRIGIIM